MKLATVDLEANGLELGEITNIWCASVKDWHSGQRMDFTPNTIGDLPAYLDTYDALAFHGGTRYDLPVLKKILNWEPGNRSIVDTLLMSRLQRPNRPKPPHMKGKSGPHSVAAYGYRLGRIKPDHEEWDNWSPAMSHRCAEDCEIQHLILEFLLKEGQGEGWKKAHWITQKIFHLLYQQERSGWTFDTPYAKHCVNQLTRWIDLIDRVIVPRLPPVCEVKEGKENGEYRWLKAPFKKNGELSKAALMWLQETMRDPQEEGALSLPLRDSRGSGSSEPEDVGSTGEGSKEYRGANERSTDLSSGLLQVLSDQCGLPVPRVVGPFSRIQFRPINLDKQVELKDTLLRLGWEPDEWNTNGKGERTSPKLDQSEDFTGISGRIGRLLVRRIKSKQRRGVIEGWIAAVRPDGRIPTPVTGLAATGRLRHSLVVNVPGLDAFYGKEMRSCFTASPGWVMVGVDSEGNQQRQILNRLKVPEDNEFYQGVLYGDKEKGTDEHSVLARAAGVPRKIAKNIYYGTMFGAGVRRVSVYTEGDLDRAAEVRTKVINSVPGLEDHLQEALEYWNETAVLKYNSKFKKMMLCNGLVRGLDGRPIEVESPHMILVYEAQGDEAVQMSWAYWWFHRQVEKRGYVWDQDWRMLIWYHDEFQFECRPEIAQELGEIAGEAITWAGRYLGCKVPHSGHMAIGKNWADTH